MRPNAFIMLRKDKNGAVAGLEGGRVLEEATSPRPTLCWPRSPAGAWADRRHARSKMETAIDATAKGDFGLSVADIKRIAKKLPRDHSAIIVLFENAWERRLKQVAAKHGGAISDQRLITPEAMVATASRIAAGSKRAPSRRKSYARAPGLVYDRTLSVWPFGLARRQSR